MRTFANSFHVPTHREPPPKLKIAVVGAGYWGPNLARNLQASVDWDLVAICDLDIERAAKLAATLGGIPVVESLDELLDTFDVDAVAIATPARTHYGTVMTALRAGKHVLVEKPLADSRAHGAEMVAEAEANSLVLMADHTYCYTPAVLKMQELVQEGALGDILFVDSVRINLGLVQPDVDVFWDLAPHDLAILDFVLPGGLNPAEVSAFGADPLGTGRDCVGHLNFRLPNDATAHVHVNWLSPTKIRQMVIGGSLRTLVWDDLNPQQRLSVYDRGVSLDRQPLTAGEKKTSAISYRLGDTWSPALPEREALSQVVEELAHCIRNKREARTGGASGLRVLSVLEAVTRSLSLDGQSSPVEGTGPSDDNGLSGPSRSAAEVQLERAL
ncbi:Gfo/Idh/MocA family protein [Pseudarthrobacter sp. DSP2-3-2b1]|uniref:Gfo/Idh/MocA family protein n=1 Tax=Pseudarthrobacter sp. DSP2-3-2b1 TaxID=2804661 RepID=UPI003CF712DB